MKYLLTVLGLTIGNFLYQLTFPAVPDLSEAFKLSFFQACAVAVCAWMNRKATPGAKG